jgi:TolB-like protein/Tfp pilus assembly protein PilF
MFTDIVGYTALMARDEEAGRRARDRHEAVVLPLVEQYHGEYVERTGDETLSSFPSALDAVDCALAIQAGLGDDPNLQIRIGIHLGDVTFDGGGVSGDGVNVASRIRPLAEPGGVCISDEVHHSVRGRPNFEFRALGAQELKNVGRPVAVFAVTGTSSPPRPISAVPQPRAARAGAWLATIVGVLLVAALGVWWWTRLVPEVGAIRSIAVLPLENLSGDPEQEYFVDGMTEVLIADLARVRGLRVISRTSSMAYRDSGKTLPQIASELNVDAVVEGSVLRAGERVRITAQLIQASSDEHLWSDSYERDLHDVLALQGEVAQAIAGEIELQLSGPEEPGEAARPVDPEALEAYLKGRHHWNKRTGADIRKSIEYFEKAIALDPDWALAHSGLAQAYVLLANYDPSARPRDSMPRARAAAERALELDDELAPAHTALAAVRQWYDWGWEGAEAEFQRALELDPSYATAHAWYGFLAITKKKDAIKHIQRARELDPLSMIIGTQMGMGLLYAREYDRSIETLRETLELDPRFALAQVILAQAYAAKGMNEEAVEVAERLARTDPEPQRMVTLALAYAGAGRREDALGILEEVRASAIYPLYVAYVYAALGDADAAFEWLEKAYERRSLQLTLIRVTPALDPLRSDPRFQDLLRRIGFPES